MHGNATAGGAYQPGLSASVVLVRNRAKMFLAGPPLLMAATGEIATDEELGGAEMHTGVAGTAEYLAENDADAIRHARDIMSKLGLRDRPAEHRDWQEPLYPPEQLLGVVPADSKKPYDVREIIARLADGSDFLDFKNDWDSATLCGWIDIEGQPVGVIGNNGPITPRGAAKAAQFIQLCDQTRRPLLFLHNTTGFMVGTDPEQNGVIKHGSKMIQAVANARVPKISILVGGSYGAGNYAMAGRGMAPRFLFTWPRSVVSVMGSAQAGSVLRQVAEAKMARAGEINDEMRAAVDALERDTVETLDAKTNALANTARVFDDGMIDPADTRSIVAFVLDVCRDADTRTVNTNTFGIGRL